jgi:flavin-dependent dehydrogenase
MLNLTKEFVKQPIKIAGAGLSGLSAGINLLKAGYEVIIYEQRPNVGLRFNNDFQGIANWMTNKDVVDFLKDINIETNFLLEPFKKAIFFGPGMKSKQQLVSPSPLFYLVKRGNSKDSIDYSLKNQFIEQGGKIIFNTVLEDADIIATGPKRAEMIARGYIFKTDMDNFACAILDNSIAPKAYAYLLVFNGQGTLAVVLSENFQNQEKYLNETVSAFKNKLRLKMSEKKKFGGLGDFFYSKSATKNGKLYVGEAAGFQDYLAGFGMYYALKSGFLAAKSIKENISYDKLWKKEFSSFLKAGISNRFLFEIAGKKRGSFVIKLVVKYRNNILGLIKKGYSFDWRRKIVFPLAYLYNYNRFKQSRENRVNSIFKK